MLDFVTKLDRELRQLDKILPQAGPGSSPSEDEPEPARLPSDLTGLTLEQVVTDPALAGIPASPLQVAITRAAQGLPIDDLLTEDETEAYFGCDWIPPATAITLVVLVCGVRAGKSFLACCAAIHAALTAPMSKGGRRLKRRELPRVPIIGPEIDAAEGTFTILKGVIDASPALSALVDGRQTADTITLKRPDGYRVEIKVVAAAKGGRTVRNRWLCGFILEEVAQIGQEAAGAVVNAEAVLDAASTRLLDGCQGWLISSPYGPQGLLYDLWKKHFGKPGRTLVVHAPTRAMNPTHPQADIDEIAKDNPDGARREFGAEWLDPETAYYPSVLLEAATRTQPSERPRPRLAPCVAAGDFATRGNAWTLVVATTETVDGPEDPEDDFEPEQRHRTIVLAGWEWIGSQTKPLSVRETCREMAEKLAPYACATVRCDKWSFDAIREHAAEAGLLLEETDTGEAEAALKALRTKLSAKDLELPPNEGDVGRHIRADLLAVRQRALAGSVKLVLPKQANGRHCDFVPSIALVSRLADATRGWDRGSDSLEGEVRFSDPSIYEQPFGY